MHYYRHHIGDFQRDTGMLDDHQAMTYLRLLWVYYDKEKPLENDPEYLAFSVRSDEKTVSLILKHFFTLDGDVWRQPRCDQEIAEYHKKSDRAKKAANARWDADAMQAQCTSNAVASKKDANASKNDANQEPVTSNQEPIVSNHKRESARSRFTPPTVDEVKSYCKERNNSVDAARFVDFYASKGWMVGKSKMKDWQAAVRNWERSESGKVEPIRRRKML